MCVYVCVFVCMYVCVFVCMYVCVYVCMYVCMYVCIQTIRLCISFFNFCYFSIGKAGERHPLLADGLQ